MDKNAEFLQQTKIIKTVAGIVSIVSAPIIFVQSVLLCMVTFHGLRMFNEIVMSSMLLAGGITMLAGRSKLHGGTENIVLFAIGLGFSLIGFGRLWYWAVWAALCLAAAIYFRVNSQRILRGEEVHTTPYDAAAEVVRSSVDMAQDAADRFRAAQPQYQAPQQPYQAPHYQAPQQPYQAPQYQAPQQPYQAPQYQAPQQPYQEPRFHAPQHPQQPYVPQAAQAAENGYTSPFTVQPTKTMAELQQEVLARKAAEQPAQAPEASQAPQAPEASESPQVPQASEAPQTSQVPQAEPVSPQQ